MMNRSTKFLLLLCASAIFALAIWWALSFETYWKSGDYKLIAIDNKQNMSLMFGGGSGVPLVGPVVFAVGENERFIVIKRHPPLYENRGNDRTVTNYFVVTRASEEEAAAKAANVRGPLTKTQFDKLSKQLSLPPFSKIFRELE